MKLVGIAVLLTVCSCAISSSVESNGKGEKTDFYHPVDHLDVKNREHLNINPCQWKTCPDGQECKAVRNPYLLQVPIAICSAVAKEDPTEEGTDDCQDFHLGVNIFNCRTEVEWRKAAENQCSLRLTTSTEALFVQVKYACRSGTGGDPVFMQAAVSCCGSGQENMEKPTQELTPPSPATTQSLRTGSPTRRPPPTRATVTGGAHTMRTRPSWSPTETTERPSTVRTRPSWSPTGTTERPSTMRTRPTRPFPTTDQLPTKFKPPKMTEETIPTEFDEGIEDLDMKEFTDEVVSEWDDTVSKIRSDLPTVHHYALWIVLPIAGLLTLCAVICLVGCIVRCCVGRRRQRRALKQFPPDTTHSAVNNSYVTSDEEEVVYSKVKPAIVFDTSDGDQLAYDMYIAVKK